MGRQIMKRVFSFLLLSAGLIVSADSNLLRNGDFDGKDFNQDIFVQLDKGKVKVSQVTEDLSWNKCVKMEITGFKKTDAGELLTASLLFGKNDGQYGVPVQPDTQYKFSMELKGNRGVSLWVVLFDSATKQFWKGKSVRLTPRSAEPSPQSWTRVSGSFKTGPKTRFACLKLMFWADSKQMKKMPAVGDYVMVDNIRIVKQQTLDQTVPVSPGKNAEAEVRPAFTVPADTVLVLPQRRDPSVKLQLPVRFSCNEHGITFTAELPPAQPGLTPVAENGKKLWKEDVLELFFSPPVKDRLYTQFAMSSGGGRYRGTGMEDGQFDRWTGKAETRDGKRICTMVIPWELIGFTRRPPAGTRLGINIAVTLNKKGYAYAPVKVNFADVDNFASIIFGSVGQYREIVMAELKKDAPESLRSEIDQFAASGETDAGKVIAAAQTLRKKILSAKMGNAPFLAVRLPLTGNFTVPVNLDPEHLIREKIVLSAAGNESAMLPVAILNRTGQTAAYRVIVHADAKNYNSAERTGLGNDFPAEKIIFREAFPVKDSEAEKPGLIFDPLPKMNEAHVLVVPPHEAGIVWLEFDCNGVKPGQYPGSIRIIPLSEPAKFVRHNYQGKMQDYPLELEVLPFKLPPPRPVSFFHPPISKDYMLMACRLGSPAISINSWYFPFKFDLKGTLVRGDAPRAVAEFKKAKELFAGAPEWVQPKYRVGYSIYKIFKEASLPKKVKVFSPEWENCWRNYLKAFRKVTDGCGIPPSQIFIELVDEPQVKYEKEYLTMTRIAVETLPDAKFYMTWGPANFGFSADRIAAFESLLKVHSYHQLLLDDPVMLAQIRETQKKAGYYTIMYECNTNIRETLHNYYRLHPWRVRINHFDGVGIYTFVHGNWGQPGVPDWKLTHRGALTYRSDDHCIPSIRLYALLRGVDDIRYWDALLPYRKDPEVAKFLASVPAQVLKNRHDPEAPDQFRKQAVELLLKVTRKQ